jgi:hypothetical protein
LALVVALQNHPPAAGETAAVLVGTALAVGLAELYSEVVAAEARTRRPVPRNEMRAMALDALAVVFAQGFPPGSCAHCRTPPPWVRSAGP